MKVETKSFLNLPIYCLGLILSSCSKEQPIALQTSSICSSREVAERKPKTDLEVMLVVAVQAADFFSASIPLILRISLFCARGLSSGSGWRGTSFASFLAWK